MKTSSAKAKGRSLQKKVAEMISDLTGLSCGRDCPIESRPMGQNGPDIRLEEAAQKLFPFTVECKNSEKWSVAAAIEQCKANIYPGTDWLLVLGKNRFTPIVVLEAKVFFSLLSVKKKRGRTA